MSKPTVAEQAQQARPTAVASLARSVKVVAWGLLGIRKASSHHADLARLNPAHIVLVGLLGLLALVAILVGVVRWVVAGA